MELKQLEFFLVACECGSLGKAAAKLYTSQPNVSKVIRTLENELGDILFERTSRGLKLTPYGKSIYEYASNIVKNANLIMNTERNKSKKPFYLSTYQSNIIAQLLVELYKRHTDIRIEHRQGTVEEILIQVEHGISEIGILSVPQKQINAFLNVTAAKKLDFTILGNLKTCIYAGPNSALYTKDSVTVNELKNLRYVRGLNDFFSLEDELAQTSLGLINAASFQPVVCTNSEYLSINLLAQTDLVDIGIDLTYPKLQQYNLKSLSIEGDDLTLTLGYVIEKNQALSQYAKELIAHIQEILRP
ncbi:MAG: LysR family transcriptional regulator [Clostridiales bacterium]